MVKEIEDLFSSYTGDSRIITEIDTINEYYIYYMYNWLDDELNHLIKIRFCFFAKNISKDIELGINIYKNDRYDQRN